MRNIRSLRLLRDTCKDDLAFLDVSKASDSVLHTMLIMAAERMGKVVGGGSWLNHRAFVDDVELVVGFQHFCGQLE